MLTSFTLNALKVSLSPIYMVHPVFALPNLLGGSLHLLIFRIYFKSGDVLEEKQQLFKSKG